MKEGLDLSKERPTEGMPDMMPKGAIDNPPQKEPQNIPERMVEEPYDGNGKEKEEMGQEPNNLDSEGTNQNNDIQNQDENQLNNDEEIITIIEIDLEEENSSSCDC